MSSRVCIEMFYVGCRVEDSVFLRGVFDIGCGLWVGLGGNFVSL